MLSSDLMALIDKLVSLATVAELVVLRLVASSAEKARPEDREQVLFVSYEFLDETGVMLSELRSVKTFIREGERRNH